MGSLKFELSLLVWTASWGIKIIDLEICCLFSMILWISCGFAKLIAPVTVQIKNISKGLLALNT